MTGSFNQRDSGTIDEVHSEISRVRAYPSIEDGALWFGEERRVVGDEGARLLQLRRDVEDLKACNKKKHMLVGWLVGGLVGL